ncbi:ATP-binding cassette domain-containing protein [SAR202 cluster bacterium AD-804-J14_MRT_500m]|nr:ATP-binding cassette domain-containing protein [SAR202 cluster bacterium AD-804-J14_MRT_500m]
MSESVIFLRNVAKRYAGVTALEPLWLNISLGERVAILGPSGSGKTTLLDVIGGVTRPDQGTVAIEGRDVTHMKPGKDMAALVGMMHQHLDLVPHISVINNVLAGRLGHWSLMRSLLSLLYPQERDLAFSALKKVGIPEKVYERTSHLSGGEQQRVAIARLLVQQSRTVLADEPVASLDPARAYDLMELISEIVIELGKTLVVSLHSIDLAREYFTRAIGFRDGEIQFDLPVYELKDSDLDDLYNIDRSLQ